MPISGAYWVKAGNTLWAERQSIAGHYSLTHSHRRALLESPINLNKIFSANTSNSFQIFDKIFQLIAFSFIKKHI